jgi:hypothetical protein
MAKPTSLASQLKRDDEAEKIAQGKEDLEMAAHPASEGKVWVRLIRSHYDAENILHLPGITELNADAVPASAKRLTAVQAAEQLADDDE